MSKRRLRIGFPLSVGGGGPTIFMRRLREAIVRQKLSNVTFFVDPFADVLVCANAIRNPWKKPYVLRLDGITYDSALGRQEIDRRNAPIFRGAELASALVFQAKFSRDLFREFHGLPNTPHTIIPNGVDLDEFNPYGVNRRAELGLRADDLVFICSAKWRAHKRLDAIVSVFVRYCRLTGCNAKLLVLGELDKVPEAIPSNVVFIGHVQPKDLPSFYRTADIHLFFSWLDNCPNTVVESLACGLPVVCTNQGGTRELVELTDGGTVVDADENFSFNYVAMYRPPEPNIDKLVSAVLNTVEQRKELASTIKREKIGIDNVAKNYVEFISQVIGLN